MSQELLGPVTKRPLTPHVEDKTIGDVYLVLESIDLRLEALEGLRAASHRSEIADDETRLDISTSLEEIARSVKVGGDDGKQILRTLRAQGMAISGLALNQLQLDTKIDAHHASLDKKVDELRGLMIDMISRIGAVK